MANLYQRGLRKKVFIFPISNKGWFGMYHILAAALTSVLLAQVAGAGDLYVSPMSIAVHDGAFGLVVRPYGCSETAELIIEPPPLTISGSFQACDIMLVRQVRVTGATDFTAGSSIRLMDQFSVATGATLGILVDNSLSQFAYVQDESPSAEKAYNARFYIDLSSLSLLSGDELDIFAGYSSNGALQFRLTLTTVGLEVAARKDDGSYSTAPPVTVAGSGWLNITLVFGSGSGDGLATFSINDSAHSGLTALANEQAQIDFVRLGAVSGILGAQSYNAFKLDTFSSWR